MDISSTVPVIPRYTDRRGLIEQIVMEAVKEHLNRRQGTDNITRNFIKFLTSVCGLIEVKIYCTKKMNLDTIFRPLNSRLPIVQVSYLCFVLGAIDCCSKA